MVLRIERTLQEPRKLRSAPLHPPRTL